MDQLRDCGVIRCLGRKVNILETKVQNIISEGVLNPMESNLDGDGFDLNNIGALELLDSKTGQKLNMTYAGTGPLAINARDLITYDGAISGERPISIIDNINNKIKESSACINDNGQILVEDGVIASPTYAFKNSNDTGFWFDGITLNTSFLGNLVMFTDQNVSAFMTEVSCASISNILSPASNRITFPIPTRTELIVNALTHTIFDDQFITFRKQQHNQNGTQLLPAIAFESQDNLGIYRKSPNTLAVVSNNTESLLIDDSEIKTDLPTRLANTLAVGADATFTNDHTMRLAKNTTNSNNIGLDIRTGTTTTAPGSFTNIALRTFAAMTGTDYSVGSLIRGGVMGVYGTNGSGNTVTDLIGCESYVYNLFGSTSTCKDAIGHIAQAGKSLDGPGTLNCTNLYGVQIKGTEGTANITGDNYGLLIDPRTAGTAPRDIKTSGISEIATNLFSNGDQKLPSISFQNNPDSGLWTDATSVSLSVNAVKTSEYFDTETKSYVSLDMDNNPILNVGSDINVNSFYEKYTDIGFLWDLATVDDGAGGQISNTVKITRIGNQVTVCVGEFSNAGTLFKVGVGTSIFSSSAIPVRFRPVLNCNNVKLLSTNGAMSSTFFDISTAGILRFYRDLTRVTTFADNDTITIPNAWSILTNS